MQQTTAENLLYGIIIICCNLSLHIIPPVLCLQAFAELISVLLNILGSPTSTTQNNLKPQILAHSLTQTTSGFLIDDNGHDEHAKEK